MALDVREVRAISEQWSMIEIQMRNAEVLFLSLVASGLAVTVRERTSSPLVTHRVPKLELRGVKMTPCLNRIASTGFRQVSLE